MKKRPNYYMAGFKIPQTVNQKELEDALLDKIWFLGMLTQRYIY